MLAAPHINFEEESSLSPVLEFEQANRPGPLALKPASQMICSRKKLFGPVSSFLMSRIGARWTEIRRELAERLGEDVDVRRVIEQLMELVEVDVVPTSGGFCHGSGLLKGQKLQAGWRRRLYVCPRTGRLRKIETVTAAE